MASTFYFYDLETSGVNPKLGRVMQFAGQRTDLELKPIGEPDDIMIKLTDDILPDPYAVMITGITPQMTHADGITEADFLRYFFEEIAVPGTIFTGFNSVRFDDEFIRFMMYRNFYDAYEWQWREKRGRWDILDAVRMMRALRPDGINWPVDDTGKPTNRLELLTKANGLAHESAHEALSDVNATIAVARMIRGKQPKLFDYLLKMRSKNEVAKLVHAGQPFVYTSGKFANAYEKTTVVSTVGEHPSQGGALVYDLRTDPEQFADLKPEELAKLMQSRPKDELLRFPVKTLKYNRCPAVAPLSVLDDDSRDRLKIDMDVINTNEDKLAGLAGFYDNLAEAIRLLDEQRQAGLVSSGMDVDALLYDGFIEDVGDKDKMSVVRAAGKDEIGGLHVKFKDSRLNKLLPLYKARNYPGQLSGEEREIWERYRYERLMSGAEKSRASKYFARISELAAAAELSEAKKYLLGELQLYGESILPSLP
jgi:exodeoxyribonuclease-1